MKALILSLCLCIAVATAAESEACKEKCKSCRKLERNECLAGIEKDGQCGCCDVCKRFEGETCDRDETTFKHGHCGYGLVCQANAKGVDTCKCFHQEMVCGSDGKTYNNLCHLMAAALREDVPDDLRVKSIGPCSPGAEIVTKPEYVRNKTRSNIVLSCEAIGFPTPTISWKVTRANGKTYELPGDDYHLVTTMRGGPTMYQVTGWLQIEGLQKKHEGDYTCVAYNKEKIDKATARVKVIN